VGEVSQQQRRIDSRINIRENKKTGALEGQAAQNQNASQSY
jgi:hypothetical protein